MYYQEQRGMSTGTGCLIAGLAGGIVLFCVTCVVGIAVFVIAPEKVLALAGLKPVPVTVVLRPNIWNGTSDGVFQNTSLSPLYNVRVNCHNPDSGQHKQFDLGTMQPGQIIEIGLGDGWGFEPGERVVISADNFADFTYLITPE